MKTDILMLIKTSELEYDDRLKKEIISLKKLNKSIVVRGVLQNNSKSKGFFLNQINFKTYRIYTRAIFPHKKLIAIKAAEMYLYYIISIIVLKPRIVWAHNMDMVGLIPFLSLLKKLKLIERIVWDQHELPDEAFFNNLKLKNRLSKAYEKTDILIQANNARLNHLKKYFTINRAEIVLNYPNTVFRNARKMDLKYEYLNWVNGRKFFITTGLYDQNKRYVENICRAVLNTEDYCLVVMGPYNPKIKVNLNKIVGYNISDRILFTGMISHEDILNITDNAYASIILYNDEQLNSKYCAPNRLYQAILRDVPVVAGNNPTMKEVVDKFQLGVVLESDGKDINHIYNGIQTIIENRSNYIDNILEVKDMFNWDKNLPVFRKIISDL